MLQYDADFEMLSEVKRSKRFDKICSKCWEKPAKYKNYANVGELMWQFKYRYDYCSGYATTDIGSLTALLYHLDGVGEQSRVEIAKYLLCDTRYYEKTADVIWLMEHLEMMNELVSKERFRDWLAEGRLRLIEDLFYLHRADILLQPLEGRSEKLELLRTNYYGQFVPVKKDMERKVG